MAVDRASTHAPTAPALDRDAGDCGRGPEPSCPQYHEAIELLGKRWTGAIVRVLMNRSPLRFSEIASAVPQLSDRLLSERMKELEARGVVSRTVSPPPPAAPTRVDYSLTPMGRELEPALAALEEWAQRWLPGCDDSRSR
jgi:DNA-binding HxlR family transcriptional regulator